MAVVPAPPKYDGTHAPRAAGVAFVKLIPANQYVFGVPHGQVVRPAPAASSLIQTGGAAGYAI